MLTTHTNACAYNNYIFNIDHENASLAAQPLAVKTEGLVTCVY